jgi:hypothetical protein
MRKQQLYTYFYILRRLNLNQEIGKKLDTNLPPEMTLRRHGPLTHRRRASLRHDKVEKTTTL